MNPLSWLKAFTLWEIVRAHALTRPEHDTVNIGIDPKRGSDGLDDQRHTSGRRG